MTQCMKWLATKLDMVRHLRVCSRDTLVNKILVNTAFSETFESGSISVGPLFLHDGGRKGEIARKRRELTEYVFSDRNYVPEVPRGTLHLGEADDILDL